MKLCFNIRVCVRGMRIMVNSRAARGLVGAEGGLRNCGFGRGFGRRHQVGPMERVA